MGKFKEEVKCILKRCFRRFKSNWFIETLKLLFWGIILFVPGILLGISFLKNTNSINENYLKFIIDELFKIYSSNSLFYWTITTMFTLIISGFLGTFLVEREKMKFEEELESEDINKKFEKYIENAQELVVCGGDLDFLINSEKQLKAIEKLGGRCKIIANYDKELTKEKEKKIYKKLVDKKVGLVNIKDDKFKIKGQIKKDTLGNQTALFSVKQDSKIYRKIEIPDHEMSEILKREIMSSYEEGKNPLIRIVLLDLGGVFFDGDHKEKFLEIEKRFNIKIRRGDKEKILLDEDLNLGKITIVEFIQKSMHRDLEQSEKEYIEDIWKSIWKPNLKMVDLVKKIVKSDIEVYPCSNLDRENGELYKERGDFLGFSNKHFFSYEMNKVKTKKEFYEEVINRFKEEKMDTCPFEILFIDDQEYNINLAKSLGIQTILFRNNEELEKELKKIKLIK